MKLKKNQGNAIYKIIFVPALLLFFLWIMSNGQKSENTFWEEMKSSTAIRRYAQTMEQWFPNVVRLPKEEHSLGQYTIDAIDDFFPVYQYAQTHQQNTLRMESSLAYEEILAREAADEPYVDASGKVVEATQKSIEENQMSHVSVNRDKLNDYDYLVQNFYRIDRTTTMNSSQLNAGELLAKNMKIDNQATGPKILIYHTHSQESYANSDGSSAMSVVGVGEYLTRLLEEVYGIDVLHHKEEYDKKSRDNAYSTALPGVEQVLGENPGISVVIDLHRDGVGENTHLVTDVNGKPTAKIMFFNGLSRTTTTGDIAYLHNPYIQDNLAFSLQMQIAAAEYYPGFTRPIYLKGYRYNMHVCPKTLLVEVGAQTNTFEEARNAMEPLAYILSKVLL